MTTSQRQPSRSIRATVKRYLLGRAHRFVLYTLCALMCLSLSSLALAAPTAAAALIPIYAIQGDGPISPLYHQWIDTYGLVTALVADGFYLQDPQGDANPATSDGIFVYTRQAPTVYVGQCVQLQRAYVDEFYEKTELSRMKAVFAATGCASLTITPTPIKNAQLTSAPQTYFEPFEGMMVELPALTGIVQGPTVHFADGEREVALLAQSETPYVDGGRVFQANAAAMGALIYLSNELGATIPEARWGDTMSVGDVAASESAAADLAAGDLASGDLAVEGGTVRAIIDYNFGKYQLLLWPDTVIATKRFYTALPPLDVAQPISDTDFTVCTYNVHGMGRGSEQYWDPEAYDQQLAKRARTIAESLQGCTIIGLQETGKPEDAERLAALLAGTFDLDYTVVSIPGPNTQSNEFPLTNSLIARRDRVEIVSSALPQGCSAIDYEVAIIDASCPPGQFPLFNRPPLVVDLSVQGAWGEPFPLTVIVNHWKSKGGDETINVVRRTAQAAHVATLVQQQLDRDPKANVIVLGDLNDYDGSGPVETLRNGTEPLLIHAYDRLPAFDRYSYIFNGGSQVLDHLLITSNLDPLLARVDPVHVNADYPGGDHEQVALLQRSSDHDPVLLQIRPAGVGSLGGNLGFPNVKLTLLRVLTSTSDIESASGTEAASSNAQAAVANVETVIETVTDAYGDFRFWALTPGDYELRIDTPAHFSQSTQTGILTVVPGYQKLTALTVSYGDAEEATALMRLAPDLVLQTAAGGVQ